ncbi:MAG TPA: pitrilysin family protein [Longimicrobium sp.]|nr:pitrilysin family protein [Longimicrobium sp.]
MSRTKRLLVMALAAYAAAPAALPAQQRPAYPRLDYVHETLPNGLNVIYHVDRSTPVAAVDVWYNVGSKHEQAGKTGFAHLFEHVMFMGSRNLAPRQHNQLLEAAGGRGGTDINGTTSFDRTNYFEQVPSNQLELALWLEADRMGTLLETLNVDKLDRQRDIVKNERRVRIDNQPYGIWNEKLLTYMFPAGHPYHHSVIGSMDDLSAASLDDVRSFFQTYYAPNNAVLVIAGDIDVDQAKALVRKHFGDIPRGPEAPALRDARVPALLGASHREVVEDANAPAPAVYVGFRVPTAREPGGVAASLTASMLAGGRASPMYGSLVRGQGIATQVFAGTMDLLDGADVMIFGAIGKPGASADSLEQALLAEIAKAPQMLDQATLDRVRTTRRFGFINGLQGTGGFGGKADLFAEAWTYYRDPNWVNTILPRLDAVTLRQVQQIASERLVPNNRAVLVFVPKPATTNPTGSQ